MNYTILVLRGDRIVGIAYSDEHPEESYLDDLVAAYDADFCDVSRSSPE